MRTKAMCLAASAMLWGACGGKTEAPATPPAGGEKAPATPAEKPAAEAPAAEEPDKMVIGVGWVLGRKYAQAAQFAMLKSEPDVDRVMAKAQLAADVFDIALKRPGAEASPSFALEQGVADAIKAKGHAEAAAAFILGADVSGLQMMFELKVAPKPELVERVKEAATKAKVPAEIWTAAVDLLAKGDPGAGDAVNAMSKDIDKHYGF